MKYVCAVCETEHPKDLVEKWGSEGFGDGLGPRPSCTALRQDRNGSGFVCRGQLVATAGDIAAPPAPSPVVDMPAPSPVEN